MKNITITVFAGIIFAAIILFAGTFFIPWHFVDWGGVQIEPTNTITITGEAKRKEKNQIASFDISVRTSNENREVATKEVNTKIESIIAAVKKFGIKPDDIESGSINMSRYDETYWDNGVSKRRPGPWNVSNSLDVILRDTEKASEFTELLWNSGATGVYGPNFSIDDSTAAEQELLGEAIKDAVKKADVLANSSGRKLGKIISVTEGSQSISAYRYTATEELGGGGGVPVEPGTGTVYKSVTVMFELK